MRIEQLPSDFRAAIDSLFPDPSGAYYVLGEPVAGVPDDWYETADEDKLDPIARVERLKQKLQKYVGDMAEQSNELGCADTSETLRDQAIGLLIAIRELYNFFPRDCHA